MPCGQCNITNDSDRAGLSYLTLTAEQGFAQGRPHGKKRCCKFTYLMVNHVGLIWHRSQHKSVMFFFQFD